ARGQPTNATNSQIQWTAEGATINANGTGVSFGQAGNATITATVRNGLCNPEGTTSGTQSCDYTRSWQVAVATVTQGPEFVAVQSIAANFPQFVTRDEAFFLGSERALPTNATNRGPIQWSVQGATYHADFGLIEFDQAGRATITATIANGATATTGYTQVWEVMVAQPMLYTVTLNAGNITDASSEFEAGELVSIIANAAPAGQEFGRWRVTSKGKPVTLENVNLNSSTLSFVMPKMDLEIRVVYRTVAAPPSYEVAVSGGTGSGSFAAGADVTVRPSNIPSGFVFGYWDIFPAGVLSIDNTDSTLSFKMPQTDITIRAVVSRVVQSTGRTVAIADIVQNADVSGWVPTTVGSSTIEATSDESGGITITASVSEDGFAAIESDVSPNASRSDSISISYSSSNTWRLYLDIPGIPHVEGYFVTLPATGGNPASRMSALARNAPSGDGSINFTLADFKNEFGVSISVDLAELVTGMSFAPETSGSETEASISISSLDVYMSENIESPIIPAGPKANFAANAVNGSIILSNLPQNVKIEVYNLQGKLISSKSLDQVNQSSGNMKIGVQAKGVYIIRVTAPGLNTSKAVSVW
ncbi:MAG: T9SS type A sorting domain-containing protein, partial [Fibromonadaceae bacterium]|nr:T9SS type A sorting domain-containing protein [Fibromonadaceae bacterium]